MKQEMINRLTKRFKYSIQGQQSSNQQTHVIVYHDDNNCKVKYDNIRTRNSFNDEKFQQQETKVGKEARLKDTGIHYYCTFVQYINGIYKYIRTYK